MCSNIIFRERVSEKKTDKSKEWKAMIRALLQEMMYLVRPPAGIFAMFLS